MAAPSRPALFGMAIAAVVLVVPSLWLRNRALKESQDDTSNYELEYSKPDGWVNVDPGIQALFIYKHPKLNLTIRGSQSQIVSDHNPTPELDRDGLTQQFAEVTRDNLGWKADIMDVVECQGASYRLIRRTTVDRTVVTGIAVRGNTTILVTLIGIGTGQGNVDAAIPMFKRFLGSTKLVKPLHYD